MYVDKQIEIKMLGRFSILVDGADIASQLSKSKKGLALLQYLILQEGASVPNQQLYEVLWPSESSSNPESALKTLISIMRVIQAKYSEKLSRCIVTDRGSYRFNMALELNVDLYEFKRIQTMLSAKRTVEEADLPMYDHAVSLFTGDLLSDGNGHESWASPLHIELHSEYLKLVYRYLDELERLERYDEITYVCRKALEIDSFDEKLHISLMNAMLKQGSINEALMQHKHATEIYYKYLGMQPTDGIQEFYKKIISADKSLDESLSYICDELKSASKNVGAFMCEYAIFKEIYNLQVRNLERVDMKVYVMLVMLRGVDGKMIEPIKLNNMMNGLQEIMRTSLRKGDVVSQFSASQFALLLPMQAKENGSIVMERVKKSFYKRYARSNVILSYRISNLDDLSEFADDILK